jgi:methylenetetrahydrofolate dehydrogenase (NADP+)/methenyltetrahydrofolate cyclohydrolase
VKILKGKDVADAMTAAMRPDSEKLRQRGIVPTLGIMRLGEREEDLSYERGAKKRCEAAGVDVKSFSLPEDIGQGKLIGIIGELNRDKGVHGVLIFRPLPSHIDDNMVWAALEPAKDVDGITAGSLAMVFSGGAGMGFPPCTAEACLELLSHYGIDPAGKRAVVIGRSLIVGRPIAMLLLARNATVTICHTKTRDLPAIARKADILIAAAGKRELIGKECFRAGQTIIDVGIHVKEDGSLCGDVKFIEAEAAAAISPVPGGVGAVTTAVLARHVIQAAGSCPSPPPHDRLEKCLDV